MPLNQLIETLIRDTRASLWPAFAPEIVLAGTILVILIGRILTWGTRLQKGDGFVLALSGTLLALYFAAPWHYLRPDGGLERQELFTGMLVLDTLTVYLRAVLLLFTLLLIILMAITGTPSREDSADFLCLILGGILGMCLMASANHLLMVFLAIEMASVPSYALAGILRYRRDSSEAALKYSVYGAGAAGILLYGISLLAGLVNSAHLPTIAQKLVVQLPQLNGSEQMVLALAGLMIMAGLAFKLSAVPFHFWCPDVFHGATAEVNAFLSVASKAAALVLLVRVAAGVGTLPANSQPVAADDGAAAVASRSVHGPEGIARPVASRPDASLGDGLSLALATTPVSARGPTALVQATPEGDAGPAAEPSDPLQPVRWYVVLLVGTLSAITCTFGNLAAYAQTNIKRLMAYSTIAHAGYMMMAVAAALALAGSDRPEARAAIAALALYIFVYLFMNLGMFALIAFLRDWLGSEEIADYAGLVRRSPAVVILMGLALFSLVGLPPLAGFIGKFAIFASVYRSYLETGRTFLFVLLLIGGVNTAISLFYYLRVVKVMALDPQSDTVGRVVLPLGFLRMAYAVAIVLPVFLLGIFWNTLYLASQAAASQLF